MAYERLISIMVREDEEGRVINGHLRVTSFDLKIKPCYYNLNYIHQNSDSDNLDQMIMKR